MKRFLGETVGSPFRGTDPVYSDPVYSTKISHERPDHQVSSGYRPAIPTSIRAVGPRRYTSMRKRRELREGARYHVSARANNKGMILVDGRIKELFLDVVKRAKKKFDFQVENFCIMGNHFHMIIRPGRGECLSSIMQWILGVFAMAYNRLCGTSGHIWGERFFSRIIRSLREFMLIFSYIDDNPVSAGQVDDRRKWMWGGLRHARTGCRDVLSESAGYARLLFPAHSVQLLPWKG